MTIAKVNAADLLPAQPGSDTVGNPVEPAEHDFELKSGLKNLWLKLKAWGYPLVDCPQKTNLY